MSEPPERRPTGSDGDRRQVATSRYERIVVARVQARREPAPVFTTVKVLDLVRFKRSFARRQLSDATLADPDGAPQRLFDAIAALDGLEQPDVVVVDWPQSNAIRLDYGLIEQTVLISAHLATTWDETRLAPAAMGVIARALIAYAETKTSRYVSLSEV